MGGAPLPRDDQADGARAAITGESEPGYLDGVPPKRLATDLAGAAKKTAFYRRANLDLKARWTGAAWPTDYWAGQVYPELSPLEGKRRLAQDFLWFCRLTDEDGKGSTGWLKHVRAIARRSEKLTRLGLTALELRGPGTELNLRPRTGDALARRPGGDAVGHQDRAEHADRGVVHEPARCRARRARSPARSRCRSKAD